MSEKAMALHWLVVGYVSPGAKAWIEEAGGRVITLSSEPPLVAVALAYDPAGAWTWSKGRQQYRQGIEYWSSGELQEASTGITLQYRSHADEWVAAEYCSVETTYLLLPDEEFDREIGAAKSPEVSSGESDTSMNQDSDDLANLDDFPF